MNASANVIGIIPARGGSKRLKNKNILPLLGKPLIAYTIEAALRAEKLDRVFVSTDSEEIAKVGKRWNVEIIKRPAELATETSPIDESLRHIVTHLVETEGYQTDIVVLMQANLPIRAEGVIDKVVARLQKTRVETVATAIEISQRPEWMKRLINDKAAPYMQPTKTYRMQDLEKLYFVDGAVIAIRKDTLMRTRGDKTVHAYMGQDIHLELQDRIYATEIDYEDDFEIAELLLMGKELKSKENGAKRGSSV
jgi:CMP-N-acetylneuraminic acid synthetase